MTTLISLDADDLRTIIREELNRAPRLYTVEQAAERMAVSHATLRRWIAARQIPVIELSPGAVRVAEQDVERYIAEHRREAI